MMAKASPEHESEVEAGSAPGRAASRPQTGAGIPPAIGRIEAIDFARGLAVCLMILSHGVNGLLSFDQFTSWGLVPIHAITKFSSSLFIMVFGIALAVAFVPRTQTPEWPRYRLKLLLNGVIVLFWYKVLTFVEMMHLHEPEAIVDALLYRGFPSYVEILGFYAIALLWLPWVLPLWARMPIWARWASPVVMGLLSWLLLRHFGFWGSETLQALLVEHPDYYTWGQLSRGPLVLLGLLIGGLMLQHYGEDRGRRRLAAAIGGVALLLAIAFVLLTAPDWSAALLALAHNAGKHPPELLFMLFSMAGALLLLALAILGGERLATWLRPITIVGTGALLAFIFHIVVIFAGFRFLLGYFHTVSYQQALMLTLLVLAATPVWIKLVRWIQRRA